MQVKSRGEIGVQRKEIVRIERDCQRPSSAEAGPLPAESWSAFHQDTFIIMKVIQYFFSAFGNGIQGIIGNMDR
jgi:hypothetical protein